MQSYHLRVLMISGIFYPKFDGSVIAVSNLMKCLQERGHIIHLITLKLTGTSHIEEWQKIPIIRVGPSGPSIISRFLLSLNQALAGFLLMKRQHIDIIHTHGIVSLIAGLILSKLFKKPVVATFHGFQRLWLKEARWKKEYVLRLTYPFEKFIIKQADAIVAQSQILKEIIVRLYEVNPDKVLVIPHIIDEKAFPFVKRSSHLKPIVLFVGTLARVHGVDLLIKAAPTVLRDLPQTKFLIVGKGQYEKSLQKLVNNLRLEKSVFFVGPVFDRERLAKYYAASSVVVVPLKYKGYILSLVVLEAMSSGRPVVTTMTLDTSLEKHGVFRTSASPTEIAHVIKEILTLDRKEYLTLAFSARKYIDEKCSKKFTGSQIGRLYTQLIESHGKT